MTNRRVWAADGPGGHAVADGAVVVEDGHMTTVDEDAQWAEAQRCGEAIARRSGLPDKTKFPIW